MNTANNPDWGKMSGHMVLKRRRTMAAVGFLSLAALYSVMLVWVATKAQLLRPGGDDYCWAVGAGYGPVGAVSFWWETFAGYLVHNMALTYTVGMPLLHLPLALGSAIPFLLAGLAVGLLIVIPLAWVVVGSARKRWPIVLLLPIIMVSWWVYWWYPMAQKQDGTNRWLAVSMLHNQNINGGYVIETSVGVLLWYVAWRATCAQGTRATWLFAVAGAWAACSGPALAVASVMMLAATFAWWLWLSVARRGSLGVGLLTGLAVTVVFSLVAHLAPGTQARSTRMGTSFDMNPTRLGEWVNHVFPEAVDVWFDGLTTPGILVALALAVFLGYLAQTLGFRISVSRGVRLALAGVTFSLLLAIASGMTNFFIYAAPYHAVPSRIVAFAAAWWLGACMGAALAQRATAATAVGGVFFLAFASSAASAGVIINMTVSMADRERAWIVGPAPVAGVVTDYLSWPGATTCWQNLVQITPKFPSRGQELPPYEFKLEERVPILT